MPGPRQPSSNKEMVGKSPFRDPAQKHLVEREQKEQQNPMKTPPNHLTSPQKGGIEAEPESLAEVGKGELDSFNA